MFGEVVYSFPDYVKPEGRMVSSGVSQQSVIKLLAWFAANVYQVLKANCKK